MGNGGSKVEPYVQPPPNPMPIEDDVALRQEAAQLTAERNSHASRTANDLLGDQADNAAAITRKQIGKAETFAPQPQPRGPAGRRVHGRKSAGSQASGINASAVLTG